MLVGREEIGKTAFRERPECHLKTMLVDGFYTEKVIFCTLLNTEGQTVIILILRHEEVFGVIGVTGHWGQGS